jgi:peptidoglycan/LPS O-acetylase OafA/YrhL
LVRSKQIQGLRAVAVILVLLFHAGWLPGGYIGVDVFYVISGYLITNLIVSDQSFSFANFYARRAKRLLPSAYLVLLVTALVFWLIAPSISRIQFAKDLVASTWYLSNISFAFWQNDYQNLGAEPSVLIHYWSLAVEEQFYLIWLLLEALHSPCLR